LIDISLAKYLAYVYSIEVKMNPTQRPKAQIFSFFSGAGLLDLGFEHEGFEVVFANEFSASFLNAYKYSHQRLGIQKPKYGYHLGDISDLLNDQLALDLATNITRARQSAPIGFIGGPPCPDFSVGGKNLGKDGKNGQLTSVYADLIIKNLPDFFLFENVKGLWRTKPHRKYYEETKLRLANAGYVMTERLTNAIEFGAPQDRDRIILIGFHKSYLKTENLNLVQKFPWESAIRFQNRSAFSFPWTKQESFIENSTRIKPEGIPEELTVEYWFRKNRVWEHPNAVNFFQPRAGLVRFLSVDEGDDTKKSFKRLHRWRYSPTAAYGNNEVHLHPYKARRLSVAEVLAIQSLPLEYALPSDMTLSDMFKTIGNGVPYLMGRGLANSVNLFTQWIYEAHSRRPGTRDQYVEAGRALSVR
jgi:DNA (cytosine-5)-methyltransferase 1